MKEIVRSWFLKGVYRAAIAMAAIGITAASAVHAKPHEKPVDKPVNVVAHVKLSGGPVTRMLLVKKEGKEYLVLGLDSSSVAILDVSEPDAPRTIEAAAPATGAAATELKVVADTLTAFRTSGAQIGASSEPKEIRSFPGVTSFLADKHGIIYVANADGLWIVKTKHRAEADIDPNPYGGSG